MIGHLDALPYAIAKSFLDQTEDAQALPFLLEIEPFMDEEAWVALLKSTWPRIQNADDYRDALRQTPYGKHMDQAPRRKK